MYNNQQRFTHLAHYLTISIERRCGHTNSSREHLPRPHTVPLIQLRHAVLVHGNDALESFGSHAHRLGSPETSDGQSTIPTH